MQLLYYYFN